MKRFYLLLMFAMCCGTGLASEPEDIAVKPVSRNPDLMLEKPKPGSKRWLKSQKKVRNTRRKKYPKMRRWHTRLYDSTIAPSDLATLPDHFSNLCHVKMERNGLVVVA